MKRETKKKKKRLQLSSILPGGVLDTSGDADVVGTPPKASMTDATPQK